MIMEMVGNRSFTLTTGNGKRSRLRRLKNGVPQGSVVAPLLFNIYISDLPITVSRKYANADDVAIMHVDGDWQAVERVLSNNMATGTGIFSLAYSVWPFRSGDISVTTFLYIKNSLHSFI